MKYQNLLETKVGTGYNCKFAIGGVLCSAERLAVTENIVRRMKFYVQKPAYRKSAKRYRAF